MDLPAPSAPSHVQVGRRPAVIFQADQSYRRLTVAAVVPGTSKLKALRFPHTVSVDPTRGNGLTQRTVFLCFQVQPVDKRRIQSPPLGKLDDEDLAQIESAVREALGLS